MKTEELNKLGAIKENNLNYLVFKHIEGWYNT